MKLKDIIYNLGTLEVEKVEHLNDNGTINKSDTYFDIIYSVEALGYKFKRSIDASSVEGIDGFDIPTSERVLVLLKNHAINELDFETFEKM